MHEHVTHRLTHALGKLEGKTDPATQKRRAELVEKYQLAGIVDIFILKCCNLYIMNFFII